jgi:hypothetical protein
MHLLWVTWMILTSYQRPRRSAKGKRQSKFALHRLMYQAQRFLHATVEGVIAD